MDKLSEMNDMARLELINIHDQILNFDLKRKLNSNKPSIKPTDSNLLKSGETSFREVMPPINKVNQSDGRNLFNQTVSTVTEHDEDELRMSHSSIGNK